MKTLIPVREKYIIECYIISQPLKTTRLRPLRHSNCIFNHCSVFKIMNWLIKKHSWSGDTCFQLSSNFSARDLFSQWDMYRINLIWDIIERDVSAASLCGILGFDSTEHKKQKQKSAPSLPITQQYECSWRLYLSVHPSSIHPSVCLSLSLALLI